MFPRRETLATARLRPRPKPHGRLTLTEVAVSVLHPQTDQPQANSPDTDSLPRKRTRETPSPLSFISNLDRPVPEPMRSAPNQKDGKRQDPSGKISYSTAVGAPQWLEAENVDLTKPLLGKYIIEDKVLKIEYESLENVCFDYGCYGHKAGACPPPPKEKEAETVVQLVKEHVQSPEDQVAASQTKVRPEVQIPTSSAVSEDDVQLAKLKKVLDEALLSCAANEKAVPEAKGDGSGQVPIKDVDFVGLEEGLIPVKVVYQNPTFQYHFHTPKPVKAKAKATLRSTGSKAKGPAQDMEVLGNKKRSFKKTTQIPGLNSASSDQAAISGNVAVDTRKPLDSS
ncbi:hypothetical protein LINPERHAP2_LOCUS24953 [Linum perenne]